MLPKFHILFGLIFSIILIVIFPKIGHLGFLLVFLSSFLIDVDHYLYYLYKKKDFSLKRAYNWFIEKRKDFYKLSKTKRKKVYVCFSFFHGIEILIILFLLGFFINFYFYYLLIGVVFHLFLDLLDEFFYTKTLYRVSLIYFKLKKDTFIEKV